MQVIKLEKLFYNNKWQKPKGKKKYINKIFRNFKLYLIWYIKTHASKLKIIRSWFNKNISQNCPNISIDGHKQFELNKEIVNSGLKIYPQIKSIILII